MNSQKNLPAKTNQTTDPEPNPFESQHSIPQLIHRIAERSIDPAFIPLESRRECVTHLISQGLTHTQIAHILNISVRTVSRDRRAIAQHLAIAPSTQLGDEMLGELERLTLDSIQRLTRITSNPNCPIHAKVWAEEAITRNYQRLVSTAHQLGYIEPGRRRLMQQNSPLNLTSQHPTDDTPHQPSDQSASRSSSAQHHPEPE